MLAARRSLAPLVAILLTASVAFAADEPRPTAPEQPAPDRPAIADAAIDSAELAPAQPVASVKFRGLPLLEVRAALGPLSSPERATAIEKRLLDIAAGSAAAADSIRVRELQVTSDVLAGETFIMTVTDGDAAPTGRTRQQLAADYARAIQFALRTDFQERSFQGVLVAVLFAVLALAALIGGIWLLRILSSRFEQRLRGWEGTRIRALRLQQLELLPAKRVADLLIGALRFVRRVITMVAVLVFVNVALALFPWTRSVATSLFEHLFAAAWWALSGLLDYLPNVLYIAAIVLATHYLLKFLKLISRELEKGTVSVPGFYAQWAMPTYKIVRFMIIALALVVVFPYLPGAHSPAFQGVSLFLGLLLSLGSTAAVANVVAGIVITYMRPFEIGDRVKIADTIGDVIGKDLLVVRVRTVKNVEVTIANAMVLNNHIINFSAAAQQQGLILHSTVTIGYDVPWRQVHELLTGAARATDGVRAEPAPFVLQTSLDDFYVSYELNAYTDQPQRMSRIYSDLHGNIQDKFNEAGVEILSPHYGAHRDGNTMAIPQDYLPKDYNPPSFRILPPLGGPTGRGDDGNR